MKSNRIGGIAALIVAASFSHATTLTFDDVALGPLTNQYAGVGVISDGNSMVLQGLSNGDPGNWGLEGTNGPNFLGNNGGNSYQTTLYMTDASDISFDISQSNGSDPSDVWYAQEYNGDAQFIGQQSGGFLGVNDWTHVSFTDSGVATLVIYTTGVDFHPYGIDNVNFTEAPEPASLSALGLCVLPFLRRKSKR